MAWSTEMIIMLRHLINDLDIPPTAPTYSDDRLQELILVSAQQVQLEVSFFQTYSINLDTLTLTPDPSTGTRDDAFMWLVTFKCCCLLSRSELKSFSSSAWAIRDGSDIQLDPTNVVKAKQQAAAMFCQAYEDAKWKYQMAVRPAGKGILGPFSVITPMAYGQAGGFNLYGPRDRPSF